MAAGGVASGGRKLKSKKLEKQNDVLIICFYLIFAVPQASTGWVQSTT